MACIVLTSYLSTSSFLTNHQITEQGTLFKDFSRLLNVEFSDLLLVSYFCVVYHWLCVLGILNINIEFLYPTFILNFQAIPTPLLDGSEFYILCSWNLLFKFYYLNFTMLTFSVTCSYWKSRKWGHWYIKVSDLEVVSEKNTLCFVCHSKPQL